MPPAATSASERKKIAIRTVTCNILLLYCTNPAQIICILLPLVVASSPETHTSSHSVGSLANLWHAPQADIAFGDNIRATDVDFYSADIPTAALTRVLNGETALCSSKKKPSYGLETVRHYVCVTVENAFAYVDPTHKDAVIRQLSITRDQSLPPAPEVERLLRTPRPVRMHWDDIRYSLEAANVASVIVESYGQKASFECYKWMWDDSVIPNAQRRIIVDIGGYVNVPSHEGDIILAKVIRQPRAAGSLRTYGMLNDLTAMNDFTAGSVKYTADTKPGYNSRVLYSGRLYSPLVHVLKQYGALSLLDNPKTYRQLRLRLTQIDNFLLDLGSGRIDTTRMVGRLRFEVRVSVLPEQTMDDTLTGAIEHAKWILQFVKPVAIPVQVYVDAIKDYRETARRMRLVINLHKV